MRVRVDSAHIAGWKRAHALRGCEVSCGPEPDPNHVAHLAKYGTIDPAEDGDIWYVRQQNLVIAGFALTCPRPNCESGVHAWAHAHDCTQRDDPRHTSCWTWTGTPEKMDLSAEPSLMVDPSRGGCGFHGWLRKGNLVEV